MKIVSLEEATLNVTKLIFFSLFALLLFSCNEKKEIPFELTEYNKIVVKAEINGKSGRFFWDTGSNISEADCDFDNLEFSRKGATDWYFFDAEPEPADFYYLPEIKIGGVILKTKLEITRISKILKDKALAPSGLDGVLGINVFEGYWCELSFSKKKIILHKEKPKRFKKHLPANLETDFFRVLIDIDGRKSPFLIDTGAAGIYFPPSAILGKTKDEYKRILLPKRKKSELKIQYFYLVETNKISIFDDILEDKTIITDSSAIIGSEPNLINTRGLLGVEFLKNYDLLFDFTNFPSSTSGLYYKHIIMERDEENLFHLGKIPEAGIYSFYRTPEGITLGIVEDGLLNTKYGVTEKTIITKIDGKPVQEISDNELRDINTFEIENFTVLENGEERIIEIELTEAY